MQKTDLARAIERLEEIAYATSSLYTFYKKAWPTIMGEIPFVDSWYIGGMAEHLQAAAERQILRLLMNVPPRTGKTALTSIAFPAWVWTRKPSERFLCASYSIDLAREHSRKCRSLIQSDWYQSRWSHISCLSKGENTQGFFSNTRLGERIITSTQSTVLGRGGNILIADDPNSPERGHDAASIEQARYFWKEVFSSRLNNRIEDVIILNQQRLSGNDISAYVLENQTGEEWVKFILPMEFEKRRACVTVPLLHLGQTEPWKDPRTEEGQLLCPARYGAKEAAIDKIGFGEYGYAGQFQQRPAPAGGGIFKRDWFKTWKKPSPPKLLKIIQSYDTAFKEKETSCYSVCTTWGIFSSGEMGVYYGKSYDQYCVNHAILLSLWRGREGYVEMRKRALRLYKNYADTGTAVSDKKRRTPDIVIIEDKGSGQSLIPDLEASGIKNIIGFNPTKYGDKTNRAHLVSPLIEDGLVYLPAEPPEFTNMRTSSQSLLEEVLPFPKGKFSDIVDTMTQFLLFAEKEGWLSVSTDPRPEESPSFDNYDKVEFF